MKNFNENVIHLMNQNDELKMLNPIINEEGNIEMGEYDVFLREQDGYSIMCVCTDTPQTQEFWEFDKLTSEEEVVKWILFLKNEHDTNHNLVEVFMETNINPFPEDGYISKWLLDVTESNSVTTEQEWLNQFDSIETPNVSNSYEEKFTKKGKYGEYNVEVLHYTLIEEGRDECEVVVNFNGNVKSEVTLPEYLNNCIEYCIDGMDGLLEDESKLLNK